MAIAGILISKHPIRTHGDSEYFLTWQECKKKNREPYAFESISVPLDWIFDRLFISRCLSAHSKGCDG
jgi:hypothetical protein